MSSSTEQSPNSPPNFWRFDTGSLQKKIDEFDGRIDCLFEPLRNNEHLNRLFYTASALGDHSLIWFLLAALKGLRSKEQAKIAKKTAIALFVESIVVNVGIKSIFRRERPSYGGDRPLPLREPLTSSFPSGHSTAAVCAYMYLSKKDPLKPLYLLLAIIIAPSRIHVKIHHASDVIGGLLIGWIYAKLFRRLFPSE